MATVFLLNGNIIYTLVKKNPVAGASLSALMTFLLASVCFLERAASLETLAVIIEVFSV